MLDAGVLPKQSRPAFLAWQPTRRDCGPSLIVNQISHHYWRCLPTPLRPLRIPLQSQLTTTTVATQSHILLQNFNSSARASTIMSSPAEMGNTRGGKEPILFRFCSEW